MEILHKQVPLLKRHTQLHNEDTNVESHDRKGHTKDRAMKNMRTRGFGAPEVPRKSLFVDILVFFLFERLFVCFSCVVLNLLVCRDILTFAAVGLSN